VKFACIALAVAGQSIISAYLMQPILAQSTSSNTVDTGGKQSAGTGSRATAVQPDNQMMPSRAPGGYTHYDVRAFIPRNQQPGNAQSTNTTATHQGYNHLDNGYMYLGGADRGTDKDPRLNQQYGNQSSAPGNQSATQGTSSQTQGTAQQPGVTQMYDTPSSHGQQIKF